MTNTSQIAALFGLPLEVCKITTRTESVGMRFSLTLALEATATQGGIKIPDLVRVISVSADYDKKLLTVRGYYQP